jgi:hypothetical protein
MPSGLSAPAGFPEAGLIADIFTVHAEKSLASLED